MLGTVHWGRPRWRFGLVSVVLGSDLLITWEFPRWRFGLVSVVSGSDLLITGSFLAGAAGWYLSSWV